MNSVNLPQLPKNICIWCLASRGPSMKKNVHIKPVESALQREMRNYAGKCQKEANRKGPLIRGIQSHSDSARFQEFPDLMTKRQFFLSGLQTGI